MKTDYEGVTRNLVEVFVEEEYKAFPVGLHDDMLDALARLVDEDLGIIWPMPVEEPEQDRYARSKKRGRGPSTWMGA